MPLLDVSELLSDPDFATTFTVTQTPRPVGYSPTSPVPVVVADVVGVVQPANSADLQRLPDAEYQKGAITIFTTFQLTTGGKAATADMVAWNGANYTVQTVDDWSQFGAGYIKATAVLTDINP